MDNSGTASGGMSSCRRAMVYAGLAGMLAAPLAACTNTAEQGPVGSTVKQSAGGSTSAASGVRVGPGQNATTAPQDNSAPVVRDLFQATRRATFALVSVRMSGIFWVDGVKTRLVLAGRFDGTNQYYRILDSRNEPELEFLTVGARTWVRGTRAALTARLGAARATALAGRYVPMATAELSAVRYLSVQRLLDQIFARPDLSALETLTSRGQRTVVYGRKGWKLVDRARTTATYIVVSSSADAHLLQVVSGGATPGILHFSSWGAVPAYAAPTGSELAGG